MNYESIIMEWNWLIAKGKHALGFIEKSVRIVIIVEEGKGKENKKKKIKKKNIKNMEEKKKKKKMK